MNDHQMTDTDMSGRQMSDRHQSHREMSGHQISPMDRALRKMSPHLTPADRMSLADQKVSRRNMYNHQKSRSQMAKQKMSMLDRRQMPSFDDEREQAKLFYKKTDEKGSYAYGFSFGGQEKFEEGNPETGVKGHYTFVDANGLSKRVDYIADKEGFRILNDQDGNRFKREVKPDLVKTRMSSYMDSSSLRHDGQENMSNEHMRAQEMSKNTMGQNVLQSTMYNNRMGQDRSSNLMG